MSTKDTANKVLDGMYNRTVDKLRAEHDQRAGVDTSRPRLSPYELEQQQKEASLQRDQPFRDQMRERAAATIAAAEATEAEQTRQRAAAAEQAFREDEQKRYIAAGGTVADFNANWPQLRRQLVEQHYLENRTAAPAPVSAAQKMLDLRYKRP